MKKFVAAKELENKALSHYAKLSLKNKRKVWFVFITLFICMQLCWRMMFEAMIAYFDMHNYLYEINQTLQSTRE